MTPSQCIMGPLDDDCLFFSRTETEWCLFSAPSNENTMRIPVIGKNPLVVNYPNKKGKKAEISAKTIMVFAAHCCTCHFYLYYFTVDAASQMVCCAAVMLKRDTNKKQTLIHIQLIRKQFQITTSGFFLTNNDKRLTDVKTKWPGLVWANFSHLLWFIVVSSCFWLPFGSLSVTTASDVASNLWQWWWNKKFLLESQSFWFDAGP